MKMLRQAIIVGVLCFTSTICQVWADTHYVDVNNPSPTSPYDSWATAANVIQDAVDVSTDGDTVLVNDGTYDTGGAVDVHSMSNRVVLSEAITLQSVHGPNYTFIVGVGPRGESAMRGVYVATGASLRGFTVTNGHTRQFGINDFDGEQSGGGVYLDSGTVSNCTITGNSADFRGGGILSLGNSTIQSCTVSDNSVVGYLQALTYDFGDAYGGGICCENSTVEDCSISNNYVVGQSSNQSERKGHAKGGGIWCYNSTVRDCIVTDNWARPGRPSPSSATPAGEGSGGGICCLENSTVQDCIISRNQTLGSGLNTDHTQDGGGGAYISGNCVVQNCTITSNTAPYCGGGVYCQDGGTLSHCTVNDNTTDYRGAGIYCQNNGTIDNCTVAGNSIDDAYSIPCGGGVFCSGSVVKNCTIVKNTISGADGSDYSSRPGNGGDAHGGGVYCTNFTMVLDCVIASNSVSGGQAGSMLDGDNPADAGIARGGGVYCSSNSTLENCTISDNRAWGGRGGDSYGDYGYAGGGNFAYGGGIYCQNGGLARGCIISNNLAQGGAGGYSQSYYLQAYGGWGNGGGVFCYGMMDRCFISGNVARSDPYGKGTGGNGGGVYCKSSAVLYSCAIMDNSAYTGSSSIGDHKGGGVLMDAGGTLNNCTISMNDADHGGGVACYEGGSLTNCIIWGNSATDSGDNWETSGIGATYAYCCTTPDPGGTGHVIADPLFVGANDLRLQASSPCIDAGIYLPWMLGAIDLDDKPRILNGTPDMGAYEYGAVLPPVSYTITVPPGLSAIANHLDQGINTLAEVFPTVPNGTLIYKWNCFQYTVYTKGFGGWSPAGGTLAPGEGVYIFNPTGSPLSITFTGRPHIPVLPLPLPCAPGPSFVSAQTVVAADFETIVGRPPSEGAEVRRWNPVTQDLDLIYTYESGAWLPSEPIANIGESVWITQPPALAVSPTTLSASCVEGENAPSQSFEVWNGGEGTFSYTVATSDTWLSCQPPSGQSEGEHDTIVVDYDNLPAGTYNGTITITAAGANSSPQTVEVTLTVNPGPALTVNPTTLSPSCVEGEEAASQSFEVWNSGGGTLSYTVTTNAPWIRCSPTDGQSDGERDTIVVNYNTQPPGTYHGIITVTAEGASGSPQEVAVTLIVGAASFVVLNNNDSGPGSLREALGTPLSGGIITFVNSLSGQTIVLTSGQLSANGNFTIDASSLPAGIAIDGNGSSRIFEFAPDTTSTLLGLTLTNGAALGSVFPENAGGAVLLDNNAVLTITACTLSRSTASGDGGAIHGSGSSTLLLNNSTLSGNIAGGDGGGIYNSAGTFTINSSTLSTNVAGTSGGGIYSGAGALLLTNSIVGANSAAISDPNIAGSFSGSNNLTNGMPLLAPLGDYGGPTQTMPPLPGSPAIDAGMDTGSLPATDQRGNTRVVGSLVDVGAVEFQGASDVARYWPLDWDGDSNAFGVEFALGTDWFTADTDAPQNLSIFKNGRNVTVTFGYNPDAAAYTAWVLYRSLDLQTDPYEEIFRYDGSTGVTTTNNVPVSVFMTGNSIEVTDLSQPKPTKAYYRFEAEMSP